MLEVLRWLFLLYRPYRPTLRDPNSYHQQRQREPRYRAKKNIVKSLWIASGIVMLSFPLLPFMIALGLFTTFLAFTILDETA